MKHAFLIIAHNEYPVLEVLLSMLDDERNDIYLHIDKRATELFQQIKKVKMQKAGFYLIENPIKVYWGDISQVQVEYLLFETALSHGGSPDKPGGLSIQLCKSEKKEFYIRYSS